MEVVWVEAMTVLEGLMLEASLVLEHVHVESNSLILVQNFSSSKKPISSLGLKLCCFLFMYFPFFYISRMSNIVAHRLA